MDIADRDPAVTARQLEDLEFTLHKLFIDAYILVRPPPRDHPVA